MDTLTTPEQELARLRDIQRELADMRDDRTVMIALDRLDASVSSLSAKLRAMRSQFDQLRYDLLTAISARY